MQPVTRHPRRNPKSCQPPNCLPVPLDTEALRHHHAPSQRPQEFGILQPCDIQKEFEFATHTELRECQSHVLVRAEVVKKPRRQVDAVMEPSIWHYTTWY